MVVCLNFFLHFNLSSDILENIFLATTKRSRIILIFLLLQIMGFIILQESCEIWIFRCARARKYVFFLRLGFTLVFSQYLTVL